MSNEWDKPTKYIVGVGLVILALYIIYLSREIISLFIIAALIAFLIRPLIQFFHTRLRVPRGLAATLSYLLVALLLLIGPLVLLPPIIDAVNYIFSLDYELIVNNVLEWTRNSMAGLSALEIGAFGFQVNLDSFVAPMIAALESTEPQLSPQLPPLATLVNSISSAFTVSFGVAVDLVGTVFSSVLAFTFMILAGIYLSLDGDKLYAHTLELIPDAYQGEIETLLKKVEKIWDAFFRGQVTLMFLVGVVVWLGGSIIGLPGAFALGIVAGLLEIIPNVGPILATIPAFVVAILQGSSTLAVDNATFSVIVVVFYALIQQLESYFVVPRILGQAVNLHPLVVLSGVLVGASVAGILGALLASPVIASGIAIVNYLYRKIRNLEPFPPEDETGGKSSVSVRISLEKFRQRIKKLWDRFS